VTRSTACRSPSRARASTSSSASRAAGSYSVQRSPIGWEPGSRPFANQASCRRQPCVRATTSNTAATRSKFTMIA
jgi:hypothetical protein